MNAQEMIARLDTIEGLREKIPLIFTPETSIYEGLKKLRKELSDDDMMVVMEATFATANQREE